MQCSFPIHWAKLKRENECGELSFEQFFFVGKLVSYRNKFVVNLLLTSTLQKPVTVTRMLNQGHIRLLLDLLLGFSVHMKNLGLL